MTRWIALSRQEHAQARYWPRHGYAHAARDRVAPVLLSELPRLLPHYALAFINHDNDTFQPVALLGVASGHNLYLNHDHHWLADYVPAALRGFPFALVETPRSGPGTAVLSLCEDHLVTEGEGGEPLLDDHGELTPTVARCAHFLQQCQRERQRTLAVTQQLAEARLIQPWPLKVLTAPEADPVTMKGLYQLDLSRLDALTEADYFALKGPAMALAHAQYFSMANVEQLSRRAAFLTQRDGATSPAGPVMPESIDVLFGERDEDKLKSSQKSRAEETTGSNSRRGSAAEIDRRAFRRGTEERPDVRLVEPVRTEPKRSPPQPGQRGRL